MMEISNCNNDGYICCQFSIYTYLYITLKSTYTNFRLIFSYNYYYFGLIHIIDTKWGVGDVVQKMQQRPQSDIKHLLSLYVEYKNEPAPKRVIMSNSGVLMSVTSILIYSTHLYDFADTTTFVSDLPKIRLPCPVCFALRLHRNPKISTDAPTEFAPEKF